MRAHECSAGPAGSAKRIGAATFPSSELIEGLLRSGVDVRLEVGGQSMRPMLAGGEIATVAPASPESLACGELVLCRGAGGRLVLHRLVAVSGTGAGRRWHTRGDALMACDEPFEARQVLGRVARIEGLRLGVAPAAASTDALWWRAASRCFATVSGATRVARRITARVEQVTKNLTIRSNSRKVRRPL